MNDEYLKFLSNLVLELDDTWSISDVRHEIEIFLSKDSEIEQNEVCFTNAFELGRLHSSEVITGFEGKSYKNIFERNSEEWKEYNRGFKQGKK